MGCSIYLIRCRNKGRCDQLTDNVSVKCMSKGPCFPNQRHIYCRTRKFGALLYLAALAQRTLCAKISCALKVFSLRFEDMLLSKCANINLRQFLHSGVCAKICMRQIFSFYSMSLSQHCICHPYRRHMSQFAIFTFSLIQ
jgi:hypothetical protein